MVFSPDGHLTTTAGRVSLYRHMPPPSAHLYPIKEVIHLKLDSFLRTDEGGPGQRMVSLVVSGYRAGNSVDGEAPVGLLGEVKIGEETARLGVSF